MAEKQIDELGEEELQAVVREAILADMPKQEVNAGPTVLYKLIGYRGDPSATQMVAKQFLVLWERRGRELVDKEDSPLVATFGAGGQGKTELCRELVRELPGLLISGSSDKIKACVCLHLSFNQSTTWSGMDATPPLARAVFWRCLLSCTGDLSITSEWKGVVPNTLPLVVEFFRRAAAEAKNVCQKRVGVCLLFDEIIKVPDEYRKPLLDEVTTLQQTHLRRKIPTFMFVTSLRVHPVSKYVTAESKRPITLIPLPVLNDQGLNEVARLIRDAILSLWRDLKLPNEKIRRVEGEGKLDCLLLYYVYHASRHFRSLDNVARQAITIFVPNTISEKSIKRVTGKKRSYFTLEDEATAAGCLMEPLEANWISRPSVSDPKLTQKANDIFVNELLLGDQYWTHEADVEQLLCENVAYIRERDKDDIFKVRPHMSLPLLFDAWSKHSSVYDQQSGPLVGFLYPTLSLIVDKMMPKSRFEANTAFEEVVLAITLVRIIVRVRKHIQKLEERSSFRQIENYPKQTREGKRKRLESTKQKEKEEEEESEEEEEQDRRERLRGEESAQKKTRWQSENSGENPAVFELRQNNSGIVIQLNDLLPGVVYHLWSGQTCLPELSLDPTDNLQPFIRINDHGLDARGCLEQLIKPLPSNVLFRLQNQTGAKAIEGVGPVCVDPNSKSPVMLLWSMKMREANSTDTAQKAARDVHNAVKGTLAEGTYLAVVVTCQPVSNVDPTQLPEGTIAVPFETLRYIMAPFGATYLLTTITAKARISHAK